jgi:hypothetical protein
VCETQDHLNRCSSRAWHRPPSRLRKPYLSSVMRATISRRFADCSLHITSGLKRRYAAHIPPSRTQGGGQEVPPIFERDLCSWFDKAVLRQYIVDVPR